MTRRRDSKEPLLSTGEFGRELDAIATITAESLPFLYAKALDEGGWQPGGSGLHTTGGDPSDATVSALLSPQSRGRREDARRAVGWVKQAKQALRNAEKALAGEQVPQPSRMDHRATMSSAEFERLRKRHIQREEELRR